MVSANPTPTPKSVTLASFVKEFSWTLTFLHILPPYLFFCEFESVAVDPFSGACALQYSTSAAFINPSVEGIMTPAVTSTMSPNTAWRN